MFQVQHLVIQKVFDCIARARRTVEHAAHHDSVVRGVVVAQRSLGHPLAPGQLGPPQHPAEEPRVQRVENLFQVVEASLWPEEPLAAARPANQLRLPCDGGARRKPLVAQVMSGVDRLFVEFGQQNVRDSADHRLRRALQQIGKADRNLPFAQPNPRIQRGKPPETDHYGRHRRPWAQRPVLLLKD